MNKVNLTFRKEKDSNGFVITKLTHIKVSSKDGKYIKFIKHSDELLELLKNTDILINLKNFL